MEAPAKGWLAAIVRGCGIGVTPVVMVPRGHAAGVEGVIAIELDVEEQLGVKRIGRVLGRAAEALGVAAEVEPWRLCEEEVVVEGAAGSGAQRVWVIGVAINGLTDRGVRFVEYLAKNAGRVIATKELGAYVSNAGGARCDGAEGEEGGGGAGEGESRGGGDRAGESGRGGEEDDRGGWEEGVSVGDGGEGGLTRSLVFLASSLVLSACGARTGLDLDLPAEDAAPPSLSPDASDAAPPSLSPDASDAAPCDYGTLVGDVFGQVTYFAGGVALPAGRYQLAYVDGCMMYSDSGVQGWTVNAYTQSSGADEWYVVGASGTPSGYPEPPGTVGFLVGQGAYADFDACVAASLLYPPVTFDFPGGPMGLWLNDSPYTDNVPGVDGRSPTWHLTCAE
jgi:hypothetical protein